jgi:serine/threonine-protein kinase
MVMELVDGPTLSELIKESPLPPDAVCVIGLQLASALEHAHFHRVVHRDLKPGNVMINSWGDVKLMDFGIAQQEDLARLTRTGMAVGTPSYMSPEQITGGPVDARSDLYSLGVMLYEALSGKRPFTGANPGEVFAKVTTGKFEPLGKVSRKAPKDLVKVIERAMAKDADKRFADATALRRAFEELLSRLERTPSSVLVNFLRARKRITETEANDRLTKVEQASKLSPAELAVVKRPRWGLGLVLGAMVGAGVASWPQWGPQVTKLVTALKK